MDFLKLYYDEALKVFHDSGGSKEDLYWLVSSILVRFPEHRDELEVRKRLMDSIVQEVKGKVLDVGCGLGILTFRMASKDEVKKAVGIDSSCELIDFCNRLRSRITEKAEFLCTDFLSVEINGKFDCIVFLYTLHDYEPELFLEKALKLLKHEGRIIIGDFDVKGLREKVKAFAHENELEIVRDTTLGRAKTHGDFYEAFLITAKR
ncbi:class I SAM-dependent methyltransferase [Thermococcus aggregans]|uniref:Class I SAM-dependent methyltransferase n=1 Tax=Thermococcus aggregans TaxID=110163 RepID=A0A9E7MWJ5_THEAG|nr:class I SAM-dependent methyltransferase [Thermococcus aggregans]USS40183.1 class I SAM-dependent methyltransferase [Thermococcus aggregans]